MNEAELVLTQVLNCDRLSLYLNQGRKIDQDKAKLISGILKRRATGEPVQYILGATEFMGLEFKVDKRVLIPRPETEILVESVLEVIHSTGMLTPKILDLGTGSGCIAVSLAKNIPFAQVTALDISAAALAVARQNAELHQVKIDLLESDLFTAFKKDKNIFDLIVSNPPYIASDELGKLAREISFEPKQALAAGPEGLDFYRRISTQAHGYLRQGGFLILEMGFDQAESIAGLFKSSKNFEVIRIIKDYNNIERVIITRKLKSNG